MGHIILPEMAVPQVTGITFFDYRHPDYAAVYKTRIKRLAKLRRDSSYLQACWIYYADHIPDFIEDWSETFDPRNAGTGRPIVMPFVLFPRQREFLEAIDSAYRNKHDLILVKSRDCGASWLAMAWAISMCIFHTDVTFGFGSSKEDKLDRTGDPDTLFYKGRSFLRSLPIEFRGNWNEKKNSAHMRIHLPATGSSVTGEAGDDIGRGGRKTVYFVDEFAAIEHSKDVDAALSMNTNCRIEMSTVRGTANVFAERARGGKIARFDFHYRDDPRKCDPITKEMHPEFKRTYEDMDPVVRAQELDCDFLSSVDGIIIEQEWVQSAINAHIKLGIKPTGVKSGALDIADEGKDKNCYVSRHGVLVRFCQTWSGKGSDIYATTERAFRLADELEDEEFDYDSDGMGAGVRGDARKIIELRQTNNARIVRVNPYRGSAKVTDPLRTAIGTDRKHEDFFENHKAQNWWYLRHRFLLTHKVVTGVIKDYNPSDIISLDGNMKELNALTTELSQPVWTYSKAGKMMVDKTPDDVASPNRADAVLIAFPYARPALKISDAVLSLASAPSVNM